MYGRTVLVTTQNSHSTLIAFPSYDVTYNDGSTESFSQWYNPKPQIGWVEDVDPVTNIRTGWLDPLGNHFSCYDYNQRLGQTSVGWMSYMTNHTITGTTMAIKETCTKCNTEVWKNDILDRWNWSSLPELERRICKKCYCAQKDKDYGLNRSIDTEETLYGKPKT